MQYENLCTSKSFATLGSSDGDFQLTNLPMSSASTPGRWHGQSAWLCFPRKSSTRSFPEWLSKKQYHKSFRFFWGGQGKIPQDLPPHESAGRLWNEISSFPSRGPPEPHKKQLFQLVGFRLIAPRWINRCNGGRGFPHVEQLTHTNAILNSPRLVRIYPSKLPFKRKQPWSQHFKASCQP